MATVKRSTAQREADLPEIATDWVMGFTLREIAARLNARRDYSLSFQTIANDVKTIVARWREASTASVAEAKAVELARLAEVERQAWQAWEASQQEAVRTLSEESSGTDGGRTRHQTIAEVKRDSRYLAIIRDTISARIKLLGLDGDFAERLEKLERKAS